MDITGTLTQPDRDVFLTSSARSSVCQNIQPAPSPSLGKHPQLCHTLIPGWGQSAGQKAAAQVTPTSPGAFYFNFPMLWSGTWRLLSQTCRAWHQELRLCFLRKPAVNGIQAASRIMKISLLSMSGDAAKCCVEQLAVAMLLSSAKRVWITSDVLHKIYVSILLAITIEHLLKKP